MSQEEASSAPLEREANRVIEEARMVLPGIQALFGFQLVAVFNNRFETALSPSEQTLHLAGARARYARHRADHGAGRLSPASRTRPRIAVLCRPRF